MPGASVEGEDRTRAEAEALLRSVEGLDLDRFVIVGNYVRFDDGTRNALKDLRQRIIECFRARSLRPNNFLLWGVPGSGKSYLVQQIAAALGDAVQFWEVNLAQLEEASFRASLEAVAAIRGPALCFIDEVDSKPNEPWPYEVLLPYLEPSVPRPYPTCFCLAGSGGRALPDMKQAIRNRPKGSDLLSRIPRGNEFVVDPLGVGDKMLVSVAQLLLAAREEGRSVREVEKLALFYIAVQPAFASARQLRSLASQAARRMPPGEDRIKYDYLFSGGDPENKDFWAAALPVRASLANVFVPVSGGTYLGGATETAPARRADRTRQRAATDFRRIAVLPFTNISHDPSDAYFADGLTEELISTLSNLRDVRVIARTSVMGYKGANRRVGEIAEELGADTILEGSVRKAGDRVRITIQLIDSESAECTWSETYDRDFQDIFAIQTDIARNVGEKLRVDVAPKGLSTPAKQSRKSAEAYTHYLKGRYFWNQRELDGFNRALTEFEAALELDPRFALAYAGLADTHLLLGRNGHVAPKFAYPKAIENAGRAIALEPRLPDPHVTLAAIRQEYEWKWEEAEREFKDAIALNPSNPIAHSWYGLCLGHLGRFREGVEEANLAQELDPLSPRAHCAASEEYLFARDYDKAIEAAERAMEISPGFGGAFGYRAYAFVAKGAYDKAILDFQEAGKHFGARAVMGRLGHAYAVAGRRSEAAQILDELTKESGEVPPRSPFIPPPPDTSLDIGLIYLGLGETAQAIEWLSKATEERTAEVIHFKCEPIYDPIQSEAGFRALIRKIGLQG